MEYVLPDLCDAYPELISVVEPVFINYGGRTSFGGEIVTIKCFEDNSLVADHVAKNGTGKVLVVDADPESSPLKNTKKGSLSCPLVRTLIQFSQIGVPRSNH